MPDKMDHISFFVDEPQATRLKKMGGFLAAFKESHHALRRQGQENFNIFSLLRVGEDEVRQSRFIAWLFDGEAGHGQGPMFLEALIDACQLDIPSDMLDNYQVLTEYTRIQSRIDVAVFKKGGFLVYLENKINAQEGDRQIDREFEDMWSLGKSLRIPEHRRFAVFLTPGGRKPISGKSDRWQTVSYVGLRLKFEDLLPRISSEKVKWVVKNWLETISTFGRRT